MDDDVHEPGQQQAARRRRWARSAALVGSGVVAGGILAGTLTATAAEDDAPASTDSTAVECADGRGGGPRGDEEELTGDTAASVTEAVLAEYPDATIRRLETDSDGVYEAHIVTADDERLTVELDESFAITGTEAHDGAGPGRGQGPRPDAGTRDDGSTDEGGTDGGTTDEAEPTD
jgi:hypothetical protein